MCNLISSSLWDGGKWVSKPVLDRIPDIAKLFAHGGSQKNHDLLRALRRAECRVVVSLCDQTLFDDFGLRTGQGQLAERITSRLRERNAPDVQALCRIRRAFTRTYDDLRTLSIDEFVGIYGAAVSNVPALIKSGSECFEAADPDVLRELVVSRQVAALDRAVRVAPGLAGLSNSDSRPLAPEGLPQGLKVRLERHPKGWWDLLRLAFREELKDPDNERARIAWQLDVHSLLPLQLGNTFEEFDQIFTALDERISGTWEDLKGLRADFDDAFAELADVLDQLLTVSQETHAAVNRIEDLRGQQLGVQRPLFEPPKRALSGKLFGRAVLLAELIDRLNRREHVDVWGLAGMGKTALAAEAIRSVVGDSWEGLAASPYPDGVVLLDLYEHNPRVPPNPRGLTSRKASPRRGLRPSRHANARCARARAAAR